MPHLIYGLLRAAAPLAGPITSAVSPLTGQAVLVPAHFLLWPPAPVAAARPELWLLPATPCSLVSLPAILRCAPVRLNLTPPADLPVLLPSTGPFLPVLPFLALLLMVRALT